MPTGISALLTIVIPTRDRPDLLALCLKSVFERDEPLPGVVVSDNSRAESVELRALRERYPISYVRQSGELSMVAHHNACVEIASTPWALLLHDDDEVAPDAFSRLRPVLERADGAGLVVCGHHWIDEHGATINTWVPEEEGTFSGESIVLRLGLDFQVSQPSCVWNVAAFRQAGGFPDGNGTSADYPLVLRLAFTPGVRLSRQILGRYRIWGAQETNYATPAHAERTMDVSIRMAQLTREIGVSPRAADQLMDYMTWWIFRTVAAQLMNTHSLFVARLCEKCELATPPDGAWRKRVMEEYPILFLRPRRLVMLLHSATRLLPASVRSGFRRLAGALVRP